MRRFGTILTFSAFLATSVFVSLTAQAADDLERGLADVAAAGRMSDAEYKKLEQDYMRADAQTRVLVAREKATLDELAATRTRNALLKGDQARKLWKALGARKP